MSLVGQLPPPIRDPSGKIYISIPAPSFVSAQDVSAPSATMSNVPSYLYIEYTSNTPHELPEGFVVQEPTELAGETPLICVKDWMSKNYSTEPPPGHIPWIGEVLPNSSSGYESAGVTLRDKLPSLDFTSTSVSTIEIPSIDCCSTLLNGSLPSACSSGWSGGVVPPPMTEVKAASKSRKCKSSPTPPSGVCKSSPSVKHIKAPDERRYTVCATSISKRREALIFNPRRTVEKSQNIRPQSVSKINHSTSKGKIMAKIDELDDFFSEGLKTMDLTMRCLDGEQSKAIPPSLVVSTSSAIRPVSLDSGGDLGTVTPSLARRRGKTSPAALRIEDHAGVAKSTIDYPDLPTAFRVSLESLSDEDHELPKYPSMSISPRMTAERMISSLREQIKSLDPGRHETEKAATVFSKQCEDAETWLEGELECTSRKSRSPKGDHKPHQEPHKQLVNGTATSAGTDLPLLSHLFPLPPTEVKHTRRSKLPQVAQSSPPDRLQSLKLSVFGFGTGSSLTQNSRVTPGVKPRKSILSNGTVSSSGSIKKVRFSNDVSSIIPPLKSVSNGVSNSSTPTKRTTITSPKRKPVPPFSSIQSPGSTRNIPPPTPMKSCASRRPSLLNPAAQSRMSTPKAHLAFKRTATPAQRCSTPVAGTPPRRGPLIFNSVNVPSPKENVNRSKKAVRPLSLGIDLKENRERSFSGKLATLTKRRSYSVGASNADKENQRDSKIVELVAREVQKKGGKRGLPFQSMLSRFRG